MPISTIDYKYETREAWLTGFASKVRPWFDQAGYSLPSNGEVNTLNIRFSCGFPIGSRGGKKATGECWATTASKDGHFEIFISPVLDIPIDVAATCLHELVHSAVPSHSRHGGAFKILAKRLGLEGRMTSTFPSVALIERLNDVIASLGLYPHAKLSPSDRPKKDGTRLIKVLCPKCRYTARVTRKWLDIGYPTCPCGEIMSQEAADES